MIGKQNREVGRITLPRSTVSVISTILMNEMENPSISKTDLFMVHEVAKCLQDVLERNSDAGFSLNIDWA